MSEARNVTPFPLVQGFSRTSGLDNPQAGALGGTTVTVELGDLAVEAGVDENGNPIVALTAPAVHTHRDDEDDDFGRNLAEDLPDDVLNGITDEVLQGVDADDQTRAELIEQYTKGIDLLGQKIEEIGASQGQKKNISRIGHPLLMEAMVKYHAGAIAELLPAAGPAKVSTTGQVSSEEEEDAQDFADMLNYYLTDIASEFYPDTSSMLMHQGYCGNGFKKLFRCPMRQRPVSESVRMIDLIVSEEATDLDNALRVTHQFYPSRAALKRMMILGTYVDMSIPYASSPMPSAQQHIKRSEGLSPQSTRPQDVPLHLYEQDLFLDPTFFPLAGKFERESPDGLPLPYKVTVMKDSRQCLGIWRNWEDGDGLYKKDNMYVRYGLVPGLGFHHWGFLQLLGNQTKALRAIWRLLIDSGMFSIFPGGVKIKGVRTSTNEIAPGPGEWVDIDVPGSTDIRQVLMALPYKSLDSVFIQFAQMVQESAARLGGVVELEVGEGRTNAPVGTVMSQIEQSTQMMAAVHKSNHRSQKQELMKLRKLFAKNPEDLWRLNPDPKRRYETASEFMNLNLLPASDPNIPAQVHRIMQVWAMLTLTQQAPGQFDIQEVLRRALTAIRIADPKTLLLTPEQQAAANQPGPPPTDPAKMMADPAKAQDVEYTHQDRQQEIAMKSGQSGTPPDPAKMAAAQAKIQQTGLAHQGKMQEMAQDAADNQRELAVKTQAAGLESTDRAADRQAHLQEAAMKEATARMKLNQEAVHQNKEDMVNAGGTALDQVI